MERVSAFTNDFRVQAIRADQVSTSNSVEDTVYNRIYIQAVLPEKYTIDNHQEVIGMLYGLDVRKPIVSFYKGYLNSACLNLTIFNPQWVSTQELIAGDPINYGPVKQVIEQTNDFAVMLKKLKATYIDRSECKLELGKWVDNTLRQSIDTGFGKVKLSSATAVEAYKSLFLDAESEYYIPDGQDFSHFDAYNAFTEVITQDKRDLLQKPHKTLLLNKILDLNLN